MRTKGHELLLPTPAWTTWTGGRWRSPSNAASLRQAIDLHGAEAVAADASRRPAWVKIDASATWPASMSLEGYRLSLVSGAANATIDAPTIRGAANGLRTLAQLLANGDDELPSQVIEDVPTWGVRGVMLDVSRDRIPTMREFGSIIRTLASLKINHLQLYTEHTFAYAGHEAVWRGWSPLTPAEVRRLDELCRVHGIELAANQNCFGHMVPWLRHEAYAHLAETHGDWMFDIWPRSGPFSLCPTDPASLRFVEGLLDELLPCFSSPWVNIGADEVYDIAYGRSREEVERRGRATVYMEFVRSIAAAARRRGKRAQFWGDIALSHPECLPMIPDDLLPLAWGYEPSSPFDQWGRHLAGREWWICPGTSTWRTITGRTSERKGNLEAAAKAGLDHGATGFMACDWGDSGHHQQWPVTLHALGDAAQAAWAGQPPASHEARSLHLFGDRTGAVSRWLDELGDADLPLRETCGPLSHPSRTRLLNQTAIFIDLFKQLDEQVEVGSVARWHETLDRLEDLARRVPVVADALMRDELAHAASHACFAAARGAMRRDRPDGPWVDTLRRRLGELRSDHARLWRVRSREGGLADSDGYFAKIEASLTAPRVDAHGTTMFE
jgi:hexosaminidase